MSPSTTNPATPGRRVFTCGHSFHHFVAELLVDLAAAAGINGHEIIGKSYLGGSRAIQHWDLPDEDNAAKSALHAGTVDVMTLSCMSGPDEGIDLFARLGAAHNPDFRLTLQELWLPEDVFPFDSWNRTRTSVEQFNDTTAATLAAAHGPYFAAMEDRVRSLNAELGRPVISVVPDAQATMALRVCIVAGDAPGLPRQSDLFTDAWGHPTAPLQLLSAYCHFAVIYGCSPVGLPIHPNLAENTAWGDDLHTLLQTCAWSAVSEHPLSGCGHHS